MNIFTQKRFALLFLTAAVGAVLWLGCGDGGNPGGGGTLSCGNRECKSEEMPDGKIWMTENLNRTTKDSWCYENRAANCDKYGRLYTWSAAKSACQLVGMRLPTSQEWDALVTAAGGWETAGSKLKSKSGWNWNDYEDNASGNGTDDFQFSALPGGYRDSDGGFNGAGYGGRWWAATEVNSEDYVWEMLYRDTYVGGWNKYYNLESFGFSVRCVID